MGLVIPTTSLSDSPTWKTWTLEEALVSGIFNIGGNAATVQIIYGTQGSWHYEDPVNLAPGSYTVKRTPSGIPLIGLRAYNAVSGQVAVIDGVISGVYDPELNVNSLSTVNTALLAYSENYTATSANYEMITGAPVSGFPAVMFMVKPVTRSTWFSFQVGISGKYHMAEIQQYVPLNTFGTFVLPTLWAYANMIAITSQNGDGFTAGVWPVTQAPGCYPATPDQPLIYQWPTASIPAGGNAAFDLSAPYYGQASLTVLNPTTNTNCYAAIVQYDTSLTQVGVSYLSPMAGATGTVFSAINQQVYIPPGRTRLQITNLGAVGVSFDASLTANPKTLAVS